MTTAGNQDHAVDAFALQMRPGVTKNLAAVIPKVTHFLKKALTAGQSFLWAKSSPWPDRAKTKADANRADLIGRAKEKG